MRRHHTQFFFRNGAAVFIIAALSVLSFGCENPSGSSDNSITTPGIHTPTYYSGDLVPGSLSDTYALWPGETATFTVDEDSLPHFSGNAVCAVWDTDNSRGWGIDSEGLSVDLNFSDSGLHTVNLIVTNDSGDFYEYNLPVPVAKTVTLPGPVSANYTCFDILADGRILALAGTSIQMEDSAGSGTFTEKATVPAADPSFIEISPDESFALVGAGAVSGYNGYIWKVDFSDWSVTLIADIDSNYAMAWTADGDVLVNAGRADYSGADIFFLDMSDYSVCSVITLEGYSSGGLAVDSDGNAYVAGAVTNNDVRVFTPAQIEAAVLAGTAMNFETAGTLAMTNTTHSNYSVLLDGQGQIFSSGNWSGEAPVYSRISEHPSDDNSVYSLLSDDGSSEYYTSGAVSANGNHIGWYKTDFWSTFKAVILEIDA